MTEVINDRLVETREIGTLLVGGAVLLDGGAPARFTGESKLPETPKAPEGKKGKYERKMPKTMPGSSKIGGQAWHINEYLRQHSGESVTPKEVATALQEVVPGITGNRVNAHFAALLRTGWVLQLGGGEYMLAKAEIGAIPPAAAGPAE